MKKISILIRLSLIIQIALLVTSTPSLAVCPSAEHIDVNAYVYDSIIYVGDVDYFSFTLPVSGAVAIYGKMDLGEVIEGTLYNSSCTSVFATGTLTYPYTYFYFPSLPAGTYVLKIEGLYISTLGNYWIYVAYEGPTTSPEMDVKGNGYSIPDGHMSPNGADNTLFDYIWGTTHTFTIINTGTAELNLNGTPRVSIIGSHAGDFSITQQPNSPVASGGSTTFEVRFQPTGEGMREATISIANDDSNENPYNFAVSGDSSFLILFPEIAIQGNGQEIMDGDSTPDSVDDTDFGTVDVDTGAVTHTFTIANSGGAELNLTGTPFVNISGAHASDFSVSVQPGSPVGAGETTTFDVRFSPSAEGLREAVVNIANNDSDEDPFAFTIQGMGTYSNPVYTLTVGTTGGGSGTVTSNPDGITCGSDCSEDYVSGTEVILTATPDTGSTFTGWAGEGCSGTGTCTVTMDVEQQVTATFIPMQFYTLSVHSAFPATAIPIAASPIDRDGFTNGETSFTLTYPQLTDVTLSAPLFWDILEFSDWYDCDSTSGRSCTVCMDSDRSVTVLYDFPPGDSDGDSLPDSYEEFYGIDTGGDDLLADFDNDGFCNLREYLDRTNPADQFDVPPAIADQDDDLDVDGVDLGAMAGEIGSSCTPDTPCRFDFDGNGIVDEIDLFLFTEDFGRVE